MRLKSFRIKNFKSIIDTGMCYVPDNGNIMILAGQNESGKSAILEALNFHGNGIDQDFIRLRKRIDKSDTSVYCAYSLSNDDRNYLKQFFVKQTAVHDFVGKIEEFSYETRHTDEGYSAVYFTDLFYKFPTIKPNIEMMAALNIPNDSTDDQYVIKVKATIKNKLIGMIPKYTLYDSEGDLLPSKILISQLDNNKAVLDLQHVFGVDLSKIAETDDPRSKEGLIEALNDGLSDDFNESWSQRLDSMGQTSRYSFKAIFSGDAVSFTIKNDDKEHLYLEQRSKGFRWFSAFHLRLRSMMKKSENSQDSEYDSSIIMLIDEPGQSLHDSAQDDVMKILKETANKGIQIIYSTHNPRLLKDYRSDELDFPIIRLVENSRFHGTKLYTIQQMLAKKGGITTDAFSPIRSAMGLTSISNLCDFGRLNVIVEGISDYYYLTAMKKVLKVQDSIFFIPSAGAVNIKGLVSIFIGWGMKYKAVFDDDKQGRMMYNDILKAFFGNDEEYCKQHIMKIKDCDGIEDLFSIEDFHKYIIEKPVPTTTTKNSIVAKDISKVYYARQFHNKVNMESTSVSLDAETMKAFKDLFKWIKSQSKQ